MAKSISGAVMSCTYRVHDDGGISVHPSDDGASARAIGAAYQQVIGIMAAQGCAGLQPFGWLPESVGRQFITGLRRAGVSVRKQTARRVTRTTVGSDLAMLRELGIAV